MSKFVRPPDSFGYPSYDWGSGQPKLGSFRSPMLPPAPPPPQQFLTAEDGVTPLLDENGNKILIPG
jgi:hypothetical protein